MSHTNPAPKEGQFSVAVGSFQVTMAVVLPVTAVCEISLGQPDIIGF